MKVLVVFNDYAEAGGERFSVATELSALRAAGVEVREFRVSNEELAEAPALLKARAVISSSSMERRLRTAVADFSPDIAHAENLFPQIGSALPKVLLQFGVPWVRSVRNYRKGCLPATFILDGEDCQKCAGTSLKLAGVVRKCYRESRTESAAAAVHVLADGAAERRHPPQAYVGVSRHVFRKLQGDLLEGVPQRVVYNAVLAGEPQDVDLDGGRKFFGTFVGRLDGSKGIDLFLTVAAALPHQQFAVVGSGAGAPKVVAQAERTGNLRYFGGQPSAGVAQVMSQSELTLVPSQWDEPFGRVAIEAMSRGSLPIVAARGGLSEIVQGAPYPATIRPEATAQEWISRSLQVAARGDVASLRRWAVGEWQSRFSEFALGRDLKSVYDAALRRAGRA